MSNIIKSVLGVLSGAGRAAKAYPATFGCAVAFAFINLLMIQFDLNKYSFILGCLLWALAFGAFAGMAAVAAAQTYTRAKGAPLAANLIALGAAAAVFAALYLSGSARGEITERAGVRAAAAIFIALIAFIIIAGKPSDETDFPRSLFMVHKSYFISILYGLVALGGANGVAAAVKGLIYPQMSTKVYSYIITFSALLAFLLFVGYFPPLRPGADPEKRERAQREPRFIEILLCYILIPIMLALTAVLLIWAVMVIFGVTKSNFSELASITAAYTIGGLWLHAMTSASENGATRLYRFIYPAASVVILVFEAWAVIKRLAENGLMTVEYTFILIWIIAAAGSILLLLWRDKKRLAAHRVLAVVACALALVAVLPFTGYKDLPVTAQSIRLESLLFDAGMFDGGAVKPAGGEPDAKTRAAITSAVQFLAYSDGKLPKWFNNNMNNTEIFRKTFGFDKLWINENDASAEENSSKRIYLQAAAGVIGIRDYDIAVMMGRNETAEFTTERGDYKVFWLNHEDSAPELEITLDGNTLIKNKFDDFAVDLLSKYPQGTEYKEILQNELSFSYEGGGLSVLLTFSDISVSEYGEGSRNIWLSPSQLFIKEN